MFKILNAIHRKIFIYTPSSVNNKKKISKIKIWMHTHNFYFNYFAGNILTQIAYTNINYINIQRQQFAFIEYKIFSYVVKRLRIYILYTHIYVYCSYAVNNHWVENKKKTKEKKKKRCTTVQEIIVCFFFICIHCICI